MINYSSICEIGCFNGRNRIFLNQFFKGKKYVGYDLNIFAISLAKIINFFKLKNCYFYFKNGKFASNEKCELFISIATIIYFEENELINFIKSLKKNKLFKSLIMHEIFYDECSKNNKSKKIDNLNIHSISLIKKEFGGNYNFEIIKTHYKNWELADGFSAIISIDKVVY